MELGAGIQTEIDVVDAVSLAVVVRHHYFAFQFGSGQCLLQKFSSLFQFFLLKFMTVSYLEVSTVANGAQDIQGGITTQYFVNDLHAEQKLLFVVANGCQVPGPDIQIVRLIQ